jgi:uncharacterized membrane protein (DUF4010 family)
MFPDLPTLTDASLTALMARFALALALGALLGSERERSSADATAPGIRTFTLLTVTGAAAILFSPVALAASVLAATIVAISPALRYRRKHQDPPGYGATTIAAAVAAPLVGALAMALPALAAAVGVAIVVILASKERVHTFVRSTVTPTELRDALKFFIVALIVLPLLPDTAFGPWDAINPHKIGLLVTALTGIGWAGYIAVRAYGASKGLPLAGFAGGFVSSTATTAAMARRGTTDQLRGPAVAAALLSKVSSLIALIVLVGFISPEVLLLLLGPFTVMIAVLLLGSRHYGRTRITAKEPAELPAITEPAEEGDARGLDETDTAGRPFAIRPALALAGIITVTLVAAKAAAAWLGPEAVIAITAISGTANTNAAAIAAADLAADGTITASAAMVGVIAGLVANTIFKIGLTYAAGGKEIGTLIARVLIPATIAMSATAAVQLALL